MDSERDIIAVSLPLAAGVALAAAAGVPELSALISSCLLPFAFLLCLLKPGRTALPVALLCFIAGAFCYSSSAIPARVTASSPDFASDALSRLLALTDSIEFGHEGTGAMVKALLTGRREGLDRATVAAFRSSGASHILALSGLHLGVIYAILSRALAVLGNSRPGMAARSTAIIVLCGFYALMTGCGPSIVRAFLFIFLNEMYRLHSGRKRSAVSIFCVALTLQLVFNPQVITSVGFQLSYLAMAGIFFIFPRLDALYPASSSLDPMRRIWSSAMISLSCQLTTAPVAWYHFHTFPKYFLLTNLLALPLSSLIMTSAVTTVCLTALGICPEALVRLTDALVSSLEFCLRTIASM